MLCPYCLSDELKVVDKRQANDDSIRRRRECLKCEKRFTTYERVESVELFVMKKSSVREAFDINKIRKGILKACEKRPVGHEQIEKIVNDIEKEVRNQDSVEVPSKFIGELIIKKLKKLDKVAYIRFASVYRDFTDVQDFEREVKSLIKKR